MHCTYRVASDCFSFVNMKDDKYLMQVMQPRCKHGGVFPREAGFEVTALLSESRSLGT